MAIRIPTTDPTNHGNKPGDGPLRVGGQPASSTVTGEKDLPSTPCDCAKRQQPALQLVRDLSAGPEKVRERGPLYLPQSPGEEATNYRARLARSVFYNAFGHTVTGLVGFIFRRDPQLNDDVPTQIREHWENIDLMGTHGDVFCRDIAQDALTSGHAGILVEFPRTGGAQNAAVEMAGAVRPYWVPVKKDHIVSWRTESENGHSTLTQLVLRECTMVPDGEYGEREQVRYRVLYRTGTVVGYRLLEISESKQVVLVEGGTYPTQKEIPFAEIATSGRKGLLESDPPLLDLAYLNIAHYQQQSDYFYSIHKTNVPILFGAGVEASSEAKEPLVIGPNTAIFSPDPNAKLAYVAHDGAALGSSKAALDDLKGDMATLGLAMLSPQKRVAETAEAKRIDKSTADSALAVTARALQDGIERALGFHAAYLRLPSGGSVTVNRDFENLTLTPQQLLALSQMVERGQLTLETLWVMLDEGNVLPDEFDPMEEKARLEAEAEIKRQTAMALAEQQAQEGINSPKSAREMGGMAA